MFFIHIRFLRSFRGTQDNLIHKRHTRSGYIEAEC